jgi:hypothetical protein
MNDGVGSPQWLTADLVDVIDGGCGLALMTLLTSGSTVVVRGKWTENPAVDHLRATVRWCIGKPDGTFRAGLEFLGRPSTFRPEAAPSHSIDPDALDCYEMMQLSPNADAGTISRVYRKLAFRCHPDNAETGDSEKFIRLSEAYRILGDPEKRARYDARRDAMRRRSEMVFARATSLTGSNEEGQRRLDRVTAEVKPPDRSGGKGDDVSPFVGTLRGWHAALRQPRL